MQVQLAPSPAAMHMFGAAWTLQRTDLAMISRRALHLGMLTLCHVLCLCALEVTQQGQATCSTPGRPASMVFARQYSV